MAGVNWGLGLPSVDIGAQFREGLERGRTQHRQNALLDAQRQLARDPNSQTGLNALIEVAPAEAMQYRTQQQAQQQQLTAQQREAIRVGARVVRQLNPQDQPGWDRALAAARSLGVPLDGVPTVFDPNYRDSLLAAGQAAEEQPEQTPFMRDTAAAGIRPNTPEFREMLDNRYAPPPVAVRNDDGTTTFYPRPAPQRPQYQDGQRETINGIPYIRQGGQWVPETQQAPAPVAPQPVQPTATPAAAGQGGAWPEPALEASPGQYPASRGAPPSYNPAQGVSPQQPIPMTPDGPADVADILNGIDGGGAGGGGEQPVLTDDDVARATAPQQPQGGYTVGQPSQTRARQESREDMRLRLAQEANDRARRTAEREDERAGVPPGYRRTANGNLEAIPGGPADPRVRENRVRPLPGPAYNRLADGVSTVESLRRIVGNFNPNYVGNLLGGIENTLQSAIPGIGTTGQNQWWSDVRSMDNVSRNELFGAALTPTEKAAWEATTINPRMTEGEVRTNLRRRLQIASEALRRAARSNIANGYDRDAITEALGEMQDLIADRKESPSETSSPLVGTPNENQQAFIDAVNQLPSGSTPRFRMLERYAQYRQETPRPVRTSIADIGDEETRDGMGLTEAEGARLLAEYERERPLQSARDSREQWARDNPGLAQADTVVRSAANALTLGHADRFAASPGTLGFGADPADVAREHAITGSDWENRPVAALGGTLGGGYLLPIGRTIPRQVGAGAGYSGAYSFNAADGTASERVDDALTGAAIGGPLAGVIGLSFRAAGRGGARPGLSNQDLVRGAAERQGVDIMPADVGGPMTRRMTSGTGQTVFGSGPIIRGAQRTEGQVESRLNDLARVEGNPVRQEVLGDRIRSSFEGYNARSGEYGRGLYANARDLADGTTLQGTGANQALNRHLQELQATKNTDAPLIAGLERLQADIAPNGVPARLTVDQMRRLRTSVRSEAQTDGLRGTDYQRRASEVLDALSDDMATQLPRAAAREFRTADAAWRERLNFIDDVENSILGPKNDRSAEVVARRLLSMSRSDSARFRRVLDTVTPEESGMIRGSAIQELGRAADGSPNAGGFSMDRFLTNYESLPERTRALLFRGQAKGDVEDLIAIARARREASQFINRSQTGGAVNTGQLVQQTNQAVQNASAIGAWGTLGTTAILENMTGRLLASQRFMRLVSRPPRDPNKVQRALRQIVIAEPELRDNIGSIINAMQGGQRER